MDREGDREGDREFVYDRIRFYPPASRHILSNQDKIRAEKAVLSMQVKPYYFLFFTTIFSHDEATIQIAFGNGQGF